MDTRPQATHAFDGDATKLTTTKGAFNRDTYTASEKRPGALHTFNENAPPKKMVKPSQKSSNTFNHKNEGSQKDFLSFQNGAGRDSQPTSKEFGFMTSGD